METRNTKTKIFSIALLIFMLVVTGFAYNFIQKSIRQQARAKFESQSQEVANDIDTRFGRDIYLLYSLRGLYTASKSVERSEFKAFGDGSKLSENFPGIYAIEFVEKVSSNDKDSFVKSVKNDTSLKPEGYPDFKIYPEENENSHLVLKYFYPEDEGTTFLGFDFSSDKNRSAAMEEALKNDKPAITERVKIIGSDKNAFVIFLPIYKNDFPAETEAERRENLNGYVGVVVEAEQFFDSIINAEKIEWNNFDMYAYDKIYDSQFNLDDYIYDADKDKEEEKDDKAEWSYFYDLSLDIAGKVWTLHFVADPDYGMNKFEFYMLVTVVLFGVIFSFFLSGFIYFLGTSRKRALALAESMTKDLKNSEERYRALFTESKDAMMTIIPGKGFLSGNWATVKLFGCRDEKDFMSKTPADLSPEYQPDGAKSIDKSREMMQLALENGSHLFEWTHKRKDGTEFPATVLLSKVEKGEKTFLQATVRDITIQKKAEEEIKKKNEELERLNKAMVGRELKMIDLKNEINRLKK
ncbi:MAG TPA: CHASE domain-containing protein [Candidatus Moranbacteria bacterium]|nr:CHASE domain-containing protein [Candidatus Moranbacteria bacterium]